MKMRSEATQTLRAGCSKADSQTNKHKNKHTNRQGRLQYTAQLSAQCNEKGTYKHSLQPWLCGDNLLTSYRRLRGVFLANHLASTEN